MPSFRQRQKKREEKFMQTAADLPPGELPGVSLVPLTSSHFVAVKRLHEARLPVAYSDDFFREAVKSPFSRAAMCDGTLVGALICKEMEGGLRVQSLVAAVPRRGIGSQLLRAVISEAAQRGIRKLSLHVHVRNEAAIALYSSLDFRTVVTKPNYYHRSAKNLEEPFDAHFMVYTMDAGPGLGYALSRPLAPVVDFVKNIVYPDAPAEADVDVPSQPQSACVAV
ncbi:naa50 [Symbiodinium sp. KB8]|nr:naa50 [Symbiodinium sp. KB8]